MAPRASAMSTRRSAVRRNAEAAPPRLAPSSAKRKEGTWAPSGQSEAGKRGEELIRADAKVIDYPDLVLKSELPQSTSTDGFTIFSTTGITKNSPRLGERIDRRDEACGYAHSAHPPSKGHPSMQSINPDRVDQRVQEIVGCDLGRKNEARTMYLDAAKCASPWTTAYRGTCSRGLRTTRRSTSTSQSAANLG